MPDLSDRAALEPLARLLLAFRRAAGETPLLLIGAAARDLHLTHAHGISLLRATEDTDLALAVPDWEHFLGVRERLIAGGFRPLGPAHRLQWGDQRLDFVPFGGIEDRDRSITWPTEGAEVMNVSGLREALAAAVIVRLPAKASIAVASLPALAVLKVWAWKERRYVSPGKDAHDLWAFLRHYAEAGNEERLYGSEGDALASFGFDLEKAGAWLLGRDARSVLAQGPDPPGLLGSLDSILRPEIDPDGSLRLVAQMPPGNRERQLSLLTAFREGLTLEAR